jgi:hypothetical protein
VATAALLIATVAAAVTGQVPAAGWTPWTADADRAAEPIALGATDHLLVSEVMTGGTGASDEFVELYNSTADPLPLEGIELVYVSASGATVSRKAAWAAGEPPLAPGGHILVANESGAYSTIADATYAGGLASTGGSVAIRAVGAPTAIDAVGWGTAASTWLEGAPAPAVAAGHSLERLPGGAAGSGQDTGQNEVDFVDLAVPGPQNRAAPPIPTTPSPSPSASSTLAPSAPASDTASQSAILSPSPVVTASVDPSPATPAPTSATPTPTATAAPTSTPIPSPVPTVTPPAAISVAAARDLPDGSTATIEAVTLSAGDLTDGGGCLTDGTAGIALLVTDGSFSRGSRVRVTGELDDRYHQRTLRALPADVSPLGPAAEPEPVEVATGAVGEALECGLVTLDGTIASTMTRLSDAVAYDLDDGSGAVRVLIPDGAAIDTTAWTRGTGLVVRGVVMQRDSSGGGAAGYRLVLRESADVLAALDPSPSASPSGPGPSGSPDPDDPSVVAIDEARRAAPNTRLRVRGVVTLPTTVHRDGTAAIQDGSGAIILRLGEEAGMLSVGDLVEVDGVRSTKSGMETLRVSEQPRTIGAQAEPDPARHPTGTLGEAHEATLVVVRGAVVTTPRRTSAQNVYFDVDDGSGPLRVFLTPGSRVTAAGLATGAWVEIAGVLGQETSGQQPLRGYRLWPRGPADVRIVAPAGGASQGDGGEPSASGGPDAAPHGGTGGPGGAGNDTGAAWPAGIPAPRLVAGRLAGQVGPTPAPSPAPGAAPAVLPVSHPSTAIVLLVVAGVLGATAATAAARPGLAGRLGAVLAGAVLAGDRAARNVDSREAADAAASPVEAAIAELVPLRVADDTSVAEDAPSVGSRSAVRRILPPT